MAKFVVAGKSDCPFYSRAELLADELAIKLPNFSVHKIVLNPIEWDEWLSSTCEDNGWNYDGQSPIIWRELINRGGKGVLLGSCNEFLEYAKGYYGITGSKSSSELKATATENKLTKHVVDEDERVRQEAIRPFKISVNNADSVIAYQMLSSLCSENVMQGFDEISYSLHYYYNERTDEAEENNVTENKMNGLIMELEDCAHKQLRNVMVTTDIEESFSEANLVVLLNLSREVNAELISRLKEIATTLNRNITNDQTKVIFAGENAVICCNIISKFGNEILKQNLMAMTRFEENKVKAVVAKLLEVNSGEINDLIIWGSNKEFMVDHGSSLAFGYNGAIWAPHVPTFSHSIKEVVYNKRFLDKELARHICDGSMVTEKVLSFSSAFIKQIKDLMSNKGESNAMFSLGLVSKGWYDVPEGLVYSFPVKYTQNGMEVVTSLQLSEKLKDDIQRTSSELEAYITEILSI